jgi:hypothetical protein
MSLSINKPYFPGPYFYRFNPNCKWRLVLVRRNEKSELICQFVQHQHNVEWLLDYCAGEFSEKIYDPAEEITRPKVNGAAVLELLKAIEALVSPSLSDKDAQLAWNFCASAQRLLGKE